MVESDGQRAANSLGTEIPPPVEYRAIRAHLAHVGPTQAFVFPGGARGQSGHRFGRAHWGDFWGYPKGHERVN